MAHPTIQFIVGDTKVSSTLRYDAGVKVATQAPQSLLYTAHADLKASADDLIAKNLVLKTASDGVHAAASALTLARGALLAANAAWDGRGACT